MTTLLLLLLSLSAQTAGVPPSPSADLSVSVHPAKELLVIDETFRVVYRIRNEGPDEAKGVHAKFGVNALTFIDAIQAPEGWTCEQGPLFGYVLACTTSSLAAGSDAEFTLTLATPQHSAMTYRIGASVNAVTGDPAPENNNPQKGVGLESSETVADLALTARAEANQVRIDVRNAGPKDARGVMVVLAEESGLTLTGTGKGWKCGAPGARLTCSRAELRAGTRSGLSVTSAAPASGRNVKVSARVRAEKIRENTTRDNAASVTLP
jgi:hypothetical protein